MTKKSSFGRCKKGSKKHSKTYEGDMKIFHMGKWKDVRMCDSAAVCEFACTITTFMNITRALKLIFISGTQDCVTRRFAHIPSSFKRKLFWKMSDKKLTEYYNKAKNIYWYMKNVPCHEVTDSSGMKEIKKIIKSRCLPEAHTTICDIYNEIANKSPHSDICQEDIENMRRWMAYVAGIVETDGPVGYDPQNPWIPRHNYTLSPPVEPLEEGIPKWAVAMIKLGFAKPKNLSKCMEGLTIFGRKGSYDLCKGSSLESGSLGSDIVAVGGEPRAVNVNSEGKEITLEEAQAAEELDQQRRQLPIHIVASKTGAMSAVGGIGGVEPVKPVTPLSGVNDTPIEKQEHASENVMSKLASAGINVSPQITPKLLTREVWKTIPDSEKIQLGQSLSELAKQVGIPDHKQRNKYIIESRTETIKKILRQAGITIQDNLPDEEVNNLNEEAIANARGFGRKRRRAFGRPGEMTGHGWSASTTPMIGFVRPMRMSMAEKTTGMTDDAYMRHISSTTGSPVPLGADVNLAQANNYYDSYGLGESFNPKFGRKRRNRKRNSKKMNYGSKKGKKFNKKSVKKAIKNSTKKVSGYGRRRKSTSSFGNIFF